MGWQKKLLRTVSYLFVAVAASAATLYMCSKTGGKLNQLENLLENRFIGETDKVAMEDAAARAMVASLGDRWSYYSPVADYKA